MKLFFHLKALELQLQQAVEITVAVFEKAEWWLLRFMNGN